MRDETTTGRRRGGPGKPLDDGRLRQLALHYAARYATSSGKLAAYLRRKLRERGWEGAEEPDVAALAAEFAERGYVDDALYGRIKADALLARGYGGRRVEQALRAAAIPEGLREALAPDHAASRGAAVAYARRRGFGPFARQPVPGDPVAARALRDKHLAAMLRAGHDLSQARVVLNAVTVMELEEWVTDASLE